MNIIVEPSLGNHVQDIASRLSVKNRPSFLICHKCTENENSGNGIMTIHNLYIFSKNGTLLYYAEWNRLNKSGITKEEVSSFKELLL